MATAAGGEQTAKRKNWGVVWVGGGGGGLLLLGGGLLAATAALGVAFFVRAATKKKGTTKASLQEAEQERKRSSASCGGEGVAEQGGERERNPSVLPPPPPQAESPPPRQVEENSGSSNHVPASATVDEAAVSAREFDFARVEEKVIKESSLVRGRRGERGEDSLPAIVNKAMVVNEPKIIQVVGEVPPSAAARAGGSGREGEQEEDGGSPVAEGTEESSGKAGGSPIAGAEPPEVTRLAKATEPTLPSLEVIRSPKRVVMSIKKGVFVGTGEKLRAEEGKMAWKDSRMAREMREKGVMDKMAVEMREKGFSRNTQMVILVSTVLFTTLMAILLHHYSRFLESTQHV